MRYLLLPFTPRYILFTIAILGTSCARGDWPAAPQRAARSRFAARRLRRLGPSRHLRSRCRRATRSCATIRSRRTSASFSSISGLSFANISSRRRRTAPLPARQARLVYQRAKQQLDTRPFGTHYDVYRDHYEWLHHSMAPKDPASEPFRTTIGGAECTKPTRHPCSTSRP